MGVAPALGTPIQYIGEFDDKRPLIVRPGQLALEVYVVEGAARYNWWYRCPCGSGGILDGHIVNSTLPVDISPSIICPGGCHYKISGGQIC
jgi:hypothetical protein